MTELKRLFMNEQTWRRIRDKLKRSSFRSRFKLGPKEKEYYARHGAAGIRAHAEQFILERLAPANPKNDGKQTPFRGHPVFIAQHATATCCRSRWHGIPAGRALNSDEVDYIVEIIMHWIENNKGASATIVGDGLTRMALG